MEESPLQVLNIDPEAGCLVQVPDNQRIERAGMLPARSRDFLRGGRQGLRNPDTSRPIRPLTRMAGDTRFWRTNGFDCYFL